LAAAVYWKVWTTSETTSPAFAVRDSGRIPEHWKAFDSRRSKVGGGGNQRAERPTNSLLNYVYSLAEIEAAVACQILGLDAGIGLLHLDTRGRRSLALDLIEPLRPAIDEFVLDLLQKRTFRIQDFSESTSDGHVRILAPLTHELVATMPRWARLVAPHAERVAHLLGASLTGSFDPTTPLTGNRQRVARARVRTSVADPTDDRATTPLQTRSDRALVRRLSATCVNCGDPVQSKGAVRCERCRRLPSARDDATRHDRARAIAAARAEHERWRVEHPNAQSNPDVFRREILPGLANIKIDEIAAACGIARSWASLVRSGKKVPAMRHWRVLAQLANQDPNSGARNKPRARPPSTSGGYGVGGRLIAQSRVLGRPPES
jgi:hypothetical protein